MADSESRENRTTVEDIERSTPQSAQMDINELNKQNKRQLMLLKKLKFKYDGNSNLDPSYE